MSNYNKKELYKKITVNVLFTFAVILLIIFLLPKCIVFFGPFIIAWVLSCIANPLVVFLERKLKIRRKFGSVLIIIAVLAAIIGIFYGVISFLFHEIRDLSVHLPELYEDIQVQLDASLANLHKKLPMVPKNLNSVFDGFNTSLDSGVKDIFSNTDFSPLDQASDIAKNVGHIFVMTIMTILASYFFVADKAEISAWLKKHLPKPIVEQYKNISSLFSKAIGSYFVAQLKIMLLIFILLAIAFFIIDTPYAVLIALLTSVIDFLPIFGTGLILWPWIAYKLLTGDYKIAVFLLAVYVVCQIVKQILQPKMVGDEMGLKPLPTLIFMFIGFRISGIVGLILGLPVGMILTTFYKAGFFDSQIKGIALILHDLNAYRKYKL